MLFAAARNFFATKDHNQPSCGSLLEHLAQHRLDRIRQMDKAKVRRVHTIHRRIIIACQ